MKDSAARLHFQIRHSRKTVDQALGYAVRKILAVWIAVRERQDGEGVDSRLGLSGWVTAKCDQRERDDREQHHRRGSDHSRCGPKPVSPRWCDSRRSIGQRSADTRIDLDLAQHFLK